MPLKARTASAALGRGMRETATTIRGPERRHGHGCCTAAWRAAALTLALGLVMPGLVMPASAQTLPDALAEAYVSNPTLDAARAALRTVNEEVPQALSNWRPNVTVTGSVGQQRNDSGSSGSATAAGGASSGGADDGAFTITPRSLDVNVTQPLFRGGRTIAETRRAEANVMAQRSRLLRTEQEILFRTATAFMDVWRDQSVLELTLNNETVLKRQLEASEDRFAVGEVTRTDVAQSESRLARATGDRVQAEGSLTTSRAVFEELVGVMPRVLEAPPRLTGLPESQDEVTEEARAASPDVLAARFAEVADLENVKVVFGALLPELSLVGSLSRSKETSTARTDVERAQILAQLSFPLYQRGFVSSQVREAKQRASQRRKEVNEALRTATQEAVTAWEALQTARARIRAFEAAVRSTDIALEGVKQENAVGARTILDILDAEQESLDARVSLVGARRDEIVASYQVLRAIGKMTAQSLSLPVTLYDPDIDLDIVRDVWLGWGDIPYE